MSALVAAGPLATVLPPAWAGDVTVVCFDAARGGSYSLASGGAVSGLRASLDAGFPGLTFRGVSVLTPGAFLGADVVVLCAPTGGASATAALSADERAALRGFVLGGGGAVLVGDNDTYAPAAGAVNSSFFGPFGCSVAGTGAPWPVAAAVASPAASPVTAGPFGTVTGFTVGWSGWFDHLSPEAVPLATAPTGPPGGEQGVVLAAIAPGVLAPAGGAVVMLSDGTALADGYIDAANTALLGNAVAYATCLGVSPGPGSAAICHGGGPAVLGVEEHGRGPFSFRWRRDGAALLDSARVSGAATAVLTISAPGAGDAGVYECVVSNACGSVVGPPATLSYCAADADCSGEADANDVSAYLNAWYSDLVEGTALADFDGDGETNANDISAFINAWYGAIVNGGFC